MSKKSIIVKPLSPLYKFNGRQCLIISTNIFTIKNTIFWVVTPSRPVKIHRLLEEHSASEISVALYQTTRYYTA
jgi:hypothetical protein